MADQIYQRIVSDEDEETETPSPQTELSVESWSDYKASLATDKSELTARDAASQHQRRPDPESPEDAHARPITVHKTKSTGPLSLNEAADDLHFSRGKKLGADLREAGLSERQLDEMAADTLARAERLDPKMPPPPEAKVLDHFGEEGEPLTVTEAANQLTDWRARHQEAQQEELAELAGEAAAARQAEVAQQPTEQPQQQPQQPQPQLTAEQIERASVAAERRWIENVKKMEGVEAALRNDYDQLAAAVVQEFPSLQNGLPTPEQVEDLRQKDPARFQRLALADKMLRERQQRIAAIAHQRGVHEREKAHLNAVSRAAARAKQDRHFEQLAAQHIPNWDRVGGEVKQQAVKTLEAAGLSQDEIRHLWTGDDAIDAHSSVLQLILAKAALYDRAQERAHQIRQTNLPQVIRPGTYRASDGDAQSVNELTTRLAKATGREALRLGTALTKARRAMNGGR